MKYIPAFLDVSWHRTTFILPLFGLCTLLATTDTLTLAISTAAIVLLCSICSILLFSSLQRLIGYRSNTAVLLTCAATLITTIEMLMHAYYYELYKGLGLFLPLTITLPLLLTRHELQLNTAPLHRTLLRAVKMGLGYGLAAIVLGAGRELVSHGSLFSDAQQLWGDWAKPLELNFFNPEMGFMLAELAPGSFIALGIGVALYNWLQLKWHTRKAAKP